MYGAQDLRLAAPLVQLTASGRLGSLPIETAHRAAEFAIVSVTLQMVVFDRILPMSSGAALPFPSASDRQRRSGAFRSFQNGRLSDH
jgi:hypothetical protein